MSEVIESGRVLDGLGESLERTKICNLFFCSRKGNPLAGIAPPPLVLNLYFMLFICLSAYTT